MAGSGGYRSALRSRDLRYLLSRYTVSGVGSWAFTVALIVFVYGQTRSPGWVAAAGLGRMLPALVASPFAGVIAERFERRLVMLTSDLAAGALMLVLAAIAAFEGPVLLAIAVAAVSTLVTLVDEPANAATIPQVVGEEDLAAANGLYASIENLTVLVGPALGALVLVFAEPETLFLFNAATFAVAAALIVRLRTRSTVSDVTEGGKAGTLRQLSVGFRAIGSSTTAAVLVGFSVLASFVYGTDTVLFALVGEAVGIGANGYGYLLAGLGVGGVLAAGLVNRLAALPRLGLVISIGMAVYCLPTALLVVIDEPAIAVGLQVVRGAGTLVVDVLAVTALQRTLPAHLIARVFGVFFSLITGAIALGMALTPPLLNAVGLDGALLTVGLGVPGMVLLSSPWLLRIDRQAVSRLAELAPRIRLLEVLQIFSTASRPVLERLAAAATPLEVEPGAVVVREGEPADVLYIIERGELAVSARGEAGSARRLATLEPPGYFGEIGLLESIPRIATVEALEPTSLYAIAGEDFLDALTNTPAAPAFLELAAARLARTRPSRTPGPTVDPADVDR